MNAVGGFGVCRSGVAQIRLVKNGGVVSGGSAFLIDGGLVTNSHVIRAFPDAVASIRFEGMGPNAAIRIPVNASVATESPEAEKDFAFLRLDEPEFAGRHRFVFAVAPTVAVGKQVGFLGYPFSMEHLTCHVAYVSASFDSNGVKTYQLDGSVNAGNSGGPLIDLDTREVVGVVTRAHLGLIESAFHELIDALRQNQKVLTQTGPSMQIMGVDPLEALRVSQAIMERIAMDLHRSANVGIGFAFSSEYVRDATTSLAR